MKSNKNNEKSSISNIYIKNSTNNRNNIKTNENSINYETIKKIILSFYPIEDEYFFNLIFSPFDNKHFFQELEKFYKTINGFSDTDPENKFYGVQNNTKIPINEETTSIELNKLNTDLIFVLVKEIILSTYEEKIDKKDLIKSRINEIFNCINLNTISFISNKLENYTSSFPVNFYAFCVTLKILLICYPHQIKNFHIGVFMNSEQTEFNQNNNNCFLSELFCCYLTYLYLSSNILTKEVSTLYLHFLDDSNIFENFTFHINNNGYNIIKGILPKKEKYDVLCLLKEIFNDEIYRIYIYLHYTISKEVYYEIIDFINCGELPKKLHLFCDIKTINNKNTNIIKEIINCNELNIHLISNNFLINSGVEKKINLKNEESINFKTFSIEGDEIYIDNMPTDMSKIKSLKLISNKRLYFLQDETEYKKLHNNICFNFPKDIFNNLNYLEELTLKHITPEQFFTLVSCLINSYNQASILNLFLEINYSHIKLLNNMKNEISKIEMLGAVDSLVRKCQRISEIRKFEIILINNNPQNNLILTKENGFYFISLVLELLKRCYVFSLKNFNNYYYPLNDTKPDLKQKVNVPQRGRFRGRFQEKVKEEEEFSLKDDVHNCKVIENLNKDLQVIYNGAEFNDISYIIDLDSIIPFLHVVKNKLTKLQPKALLINIVKFCNMKMNAPRQYSVCNFNN